MRKRRFQVLFCNVLATAMLCCSAVTFSQEKVLLPYESVLTQASRRSGLVGRVLNDQQGNLYVVGSYDDNNFNQFGQILELSPPPKQFPSTWRSQSIVSMQGPVSGLVMDKGGRMYGTAGGGTGFGYVFQLVPSGGQWVQNILYNFKGGSDASVPTSTLTLDDVGDIYGASLYGPIFQLKPPAPGSSAWKESVIYGFQNTVGVYSVLGLTVDKHGNVFGATSCFFNNLPDIVFELHPPGSSGAWTEETLYTFPASPYLSCGGEVVPTFDSAGNLYGTRAGQIVKEQWLDNGYVYQLSPPSTSGGQWTFSTLYA